MVALVDSVAKLMAAEVLRAGSLETSSCKRGGSLRGCRSWIEELRHSQSVTRAFQQLIANLLQVCDCVSSSSEREPRPASQCTSARQKTQVQHRNLKDCDRQAIKPKWCTPTKLELAVTVFHVNNMPNKSWHWTWSRPKQLYSYNIFGYK